MDKIGGDMKDKSMAEYDAKCDAIRAGNTRAVDVARIEEIILAKIIKWGMSNGVSERIKELFAKETAKAIADELGGEVKL